MELKSKAMVTPTRIFHLHVDGNNLPDRSGDAIDIVNQLLKKYGVMVSKATLYKIQKGSEKEIKHKHSAHRFKVISSQ
jgi:hypothetical protein